MIKELVNKPMTDQYGNTYGKYPISNYDIVKKINEIIRYLNEKEEQKTKWHKPTELPEGDTEVLAQYGNFSYANFVVLKYDNGFWWQHLPPMPPIIPDGGWLGIDESAILGWAYIEGDKK